MRADGARPGHIVVVMCRDLLSMSRSSVTNAIIITAACTGITGSGNSRGGDRVQSEAGTVLLPVLLWALLWAVQRMVQIATSVKAD